MKFMSSLFKGSFEAKTTVIHASPLFYIYFSVHDTDAGTNPY